MLGSVGAAVSRQLVRRTKPGPAALIAAWSLTCTHHSFTGKLRGSGLCPMSQKTERKQRQGNLPTDT